MKRPAAAPAGGAAKKPAAVQERGSTKRAGPEESPTLRKCSAVAKAVRAASGFPAAVLEMLGSSIEDSLGVAKDERHPFQEQVASMFGEVLTASESELAGQVSALEAKLAEADSEKATRAAAEQAAVEELGSKAEALAQAQEAANKASGALATTQEALADAKAAVAAGETDLEAALAQRAKLQAAAEQWFAPLKEGSVEAAKTEECVAAVLAVGREFSFDPTLLSTLPAASLKAPDARGSFDSLIFQQVEEVFRGRIAALGEMIESAEPAKRERVEKTEAASSEAEAAKAAKEACMAALEAAKAEHKEALAAKRAAAQATQQLGPELRRAGAALQHARAGLDALRSGPLAAYWELLERQGAAAEAPEGGALEAVPAAEKAPEKAEEALPEPGAAPAE